jgi:acetate kinase
VNVFVLNAGSSSFKAAYFEGQNVAVVRTREEFAIARDVARLMSRGGQ